MVCFSGKIDSFCDDKKDALQRVWMGEHASKASLWPKKGKLFLLENQRKKSEKEYSLLSLPKCGKEGMFKPPHPAHKATSLPVVLRDPHTLEEKCKETALYTEILVSCQTGSDQVSGSAIISSAWLLALAFLPGRENQDLLTPGDPGSRWAWGTGRRWRSALWELQLLADWGVLFFKITTTMTHYFHGWCILITNACLFCLCITLNCILDGVISFYSPKKEKKSIRLPHIWDSSTFTFWKLN